MQTQRLPRKITALIFSYSAYSETKSTPSCADNLIKGEKNNKNLIKSLALMSSVIDVL